MSMQIEIAETHPPRAGKKLGKVKTRTGEEFGCWPDKLSTLQVGQRYEIEISENEYNGRTYKKITKIVPIKDRVAKPHQASTNDAEWLFVREMLAAGIKNGAVIFGPAELRKAVLMLRTLWREVAD